MYAALRVGQVWKYAGFACCVSNSVEGGEERERYACFVLVALRTWRASRVRVFEQLVLYDIVGGIVSVAGTSPTGAHRVCRQYYRCSRRSSLCFKQVKLSHRYRFTCHCMCYLLVLQCSGSMDTLYECEPRR